MLGYVISNKKYLDNTNYKIERFNVLQKTTLNIFIVKLNKICYMNNILLNASIHGHVEVLEWYKKSGYKIICNDKFIIEASKNENVNVLEWFKNNGFVINDTCAILTAIDYYCIEILEWYRNNEWNFKNYSTYLLDIDVHLYYFVFEYKLKILNWFKKHKLKIKYSKMNLFCGNIKIISWAIGYIHTKKVIKWKIRKNLKYKTKNNYIKGYNKN